VEFYYFNTICLNQKYTVC